MEPSNAPVHPGAREQRQPNKLGWVLLLIGAGGLLLNHWSATSSAKVYIWLLVICPVLALLGIGALYDGRLLKAAGQDSASVPLPYRIGAVVIVVIALAISAWLTLAVYHAS